MSLKFPKIKKFNYLENTMVLIGLLLLMLLLVSNLVFSTYITQNAGEIPVITESIFQASVLLAAAVILFYFLFKCLPKITDKNLFIIGFVVYTVLATYLIFNVEPQIRADAYSVYEGAAQMAEGDYGALKDGGYFFYYPHQLGLAMYNSVINLISSNITVHFFVNYGMLMLLYLLTWKCTVLMFDGEEQSIKLTIILMFLFFPALFFVLFLYGHIPGCVCVMGALTFFIKKERGLGKCNDIGIIVLLTLACAIRNNYMIAVITIAILYVLCAIRKLKAIQIVIAILIITTASTGGQLVKDYYQDQSGIEINEGIPKILWIAMGLQDDDTGDYAGGWYNSFAKKAYSQAERNEEIAADIGKAEIKNRIEDFTADYRYTVNFFGEKMISTWTEGTYQSIWSGPLEDCGQDVNTNILKSIYSGGKLFKGVHLLGRMITLSIYIGTIAFYVLRLINKENLYITYYFPIIYLCGGFLFHLIWETKSQYVWTYVYMLIPLAACGWKMLIEQMIQNKRRTIIYEQT